MSSYLRDLHLFPISLSSNLFPKVSESVARILLIQHDWNTEKILERFILFILNSISLSPR